MQVLLNNLSPLLIHTITDNNQGNITKYNWLSMWSQHSCPCCSYGLLRHMGRDGIYWRCSHCYQEMPVWEISKCRNSYVSLHEFQNKHLDKIWQLS
jgi:hypothetical protein